MIPRTYVIGITAVTVNNCPQTEAINFLENLKKSVLPNMQVEKIRPYPKFEGALKLEMRWTILVQSDIELRTQCLAIMQQLAQPWISLNEDEPSNLEYIFQVTDASFYAFRPFRIIRWCHWQVL